MTILAGIAVDAAEFAIGQVLDHTTTRIELTQFVPMNGGLTPYFWKEADGEKAAFEQRVRADERVASLTDLDGRVGAHLYHIEWASEMDGFLSAVHDADILVEDGHTTQEGQRWLFRLRAWDREELSAFQQACFDHDVPLDIRRVHHNPDTGPAEGPIGHRLSDKQREALVLALQQGYFEIPRGTSQTALAEEVGITRQSFSRRLKRAQRTVFEDVFWGALADGTDHDS